MGTPRSPCQQKADAAPAGKRSTFRMPWDMRKPQKSPGKQSLMRFPLPGKTESFARILTHWDKRKACDILAEQQFLENVYRARPDPAPVLAEVFAEQPAKKRRLAFPPPTVHERLAFPPPTAHETRRVA